MTTASSRGHRRAEPAVVDPAARRPAGRRGRDDAGRAGASRSQVEVVELRDYAHDLANNLLTGLPDAARCGARSTRSPRPTALIAVTPIFSASYSGLFKIVLRRPRPQCARRHAGADRRDRRHRPALAGARPRAAPAVRLPAGDRRADRGVRRHRGLRRRSTRTGASPSGSTAAATELVALVGPAPRPTRAPHAADAAAVAFGSAADLPPARGRRLRDADPFDGLVPFEELLARR